MMCHGAIVDVEKETGSLSFFILGCNNAYISTEGPIRQGDLSRHTLSGSPV